MSDLERMSTDQLTELNITLGQQKDAIQDRRREINRVLDRRAEFETSARQTVALPVELREAILARSTRDFADRVNEMLAEPEAPPEQTIEPEGILSEETVGEPGRRRWFR